MMDAEGLLIREEQTNSEMMLFVTGDVLVANAAELQRHIDSAIARGVNDLTLDLTSVQYMDSFGIGVIVQTQSNIDNQEESRFVVVANDPLLSLFRKSNLEGYINIVSADEMGA